VGTPGYMPPPPERPAHRRRIFTLWAWCFYVLSTGRNAAYFPEIATTLVRGGSGGFSPVEHRHPQSLSSGPGAALCVGCGNAPRLQEAQKTLEED